MKYTLHMSTEEESSKQLPSKRVGQAEVKYCKAWSVTTVVTRAAASFTRSSRRRRRQRSPFPSAHAHASRNMHK